MKVVEVEDVSLSKVPMLRYEKTANVMNMIQPPNARHTTDLIS